MNKKINLTTPLIKDTVIKLKAGDIVSINGVIYTARDTAHKRMIKDYNNNNKFPFNINNQIIYYCGPAPNKPNKIIGSAGPTTSSRMDMFTPFLLDKGLTGMIGKGLRNKEVINSMVKNKAVYIGATGGAGALISECIAQSEVIAYDDLGTEAIFKLTVKDFPGIVIIDCFGNNLYDRN